MFTKINVILQIIIILLSSITLSASFNKILIKIQNKRHLSQPLREELSVIHNGKIHTPTMGGCGIFLSMLLSILICDINIFMNRKIIAFIILILVFFILGLIDDLLKICKRNYHGLSDKIRFIMEILVSLLFLKSLGYNFIDFQKVHFLKNSIFIGVLCILLLSFIVVGTANAVNLSDGLDGLATCLYIIAIMPFTIYAFKCGNQALGKVLLSSFGACIGFIIFNMHPSKIFMGDCGSLLLGSMLGASAIILRQELILALIGLVFIFETLSVIIQVLSYKLTGKRVFLMAPFHHHLELLGYSEEKVVLIFMTIAYFFSFIASVLLI